MNLAIIQKLPFLALEAQSWAQSHGLIIGQNTVTHCPVTLLPFPVPVQIYEKAINLSTHWNFLIDTISRDHEFLIQTLSSVAQADSFIRRLLEILQITHNEGVRQPLSLGLHRCDYMFEGSCVPDSTKFSKQVSESQLLQVKINTISSSFGALTDQMSQLHKYLVSRHLTDIYHLECLPENNCLSKITDLFHLAVQLYAEAPMTPCLDDSKGCIGTPMNQLVVLMIVPPNEVNATDQRLLEYRLWENHQIPVIRRTLLQIYSSACLNHNYELSIDGYTIAVAYFRTGDTLNDYPSQKSWDAVLMIERSIAIKCPSIGSHLAGSQKIQEALCVPGCLEKFLSIENAQYLRSCLTGFWGLNNDDEETKVIIATAIQQPDKFILKSQREGGGNNICGQEIARILSIASIEERSAYILMKRIRPMKKMTAIMRNGKLSVGLCSTELGIFSGFLGNGQQIFANTINGHLLRTQCDVNEAGVMAGFACFDSPYLVDRGTI